MKRVTACAAAVIAAACSGTQAQPVAPIRLNQLGELPDGVKIAVLPTTSTQPLDWVLLTGSGKVAARGKTIPFGADRWSGESVHRIDFSSSTATGQGLRLKVGDVASRPFAISAKVYDRLPYDALNYFYQTRAG